MHEPADAGGAGVRQDEPITQMEGPMDKTDRKTEPGKLTIKRETLRVLTPAELRLVAGGGARRTAYCC